MLHTKIGLDKTIALTREIMNGNAQVNKYININKQFGEMVSFNFTACSSSKPIPIEHIGLAEMAYNQAVSVFSTTVVNKGEEPKTVFEPLTEGSNLSNFIDNCQQDTLAWYKQGDKNLSMNYAWGESKVLRYDLTKFQRFYDKHTEACSDREATIVGVMDCAMKEYLTQAEANGVEVDQSKFWYSELDAFCQKHHDLLTRTQEAFPAPAPLTDDQILENLEQ